jgi:hypothetical protein
MAGLKRKWILLLAFALPGAARHATAQLKAGGSLTGKLTDSYSTPLGGATVILRNAATGAESRTTAGKNGAYRFTGLDAGEYTLEADSPRLGRGRVDGIVVAAGQAARVQAAIELNLPPPEPIKLPGVINPELPLTAKLPSLGNNWGPRASLALGSAEGHWPVLRLGYGKRSGEPWAPPAHLHRHQLRSRRESRHHHLRCYRRHRRGAHQDASDYRTVLC